MKRLYARCVVGASELALPHRPCPAALPWTTHGTIDPVWATRGWQRVGFGGIGVLSWGHSPGEIEKGLWKAILSSRHRFDLLWMTG